MATKIPSMTVTFDDGTVVVVEPKTRDVVRAEELGIDFTAAVGAKAMWTVAFVGLQRMSRKGLLPEGVVVPASLEDMIDNADVETNDDAEDDEGKAEGQGPLPG